MCLADGSWWRSASLCEGVPCPLGVQSHLHSLAQTDDICLARGGSALNCCLTKCIARREGVAEAVVQLNWHSLTDVGLSSSESVTGTGDQLFIRNSESFEPLCIDDSTKSTHSHTPVSAGSGLIPDSHTPISMGSGLVPDSHTPIPMGSGLVPDSLASDLQSDRVVQ